MKRRTRPWLVCLLSLMALTGLHSQTVELTWLPNTESDLAGYKIYWGSRSGFYTAMQHVGPDTVFTLNNLPEDGYTFVAVTAYDDAFNESDFSHELVIENWRLVQFFSLGGGYPNPSNPDASFPYRLSSDHDVFIAIYNIMGQRVRVLVDDHVPAGSYTAFWDGTDNSGHRVASGTYFCRMEVGGLGMSTKIVVSR